MAMVRRPKPVVDTLGVGKGNTYWNENLYVRPSASTVAHLADTHGREAVYERYGWLGREVLMDMIIEGHRQAQ